MLLLRKAATQALASSAARLLLRPLSAMATNGDGYAYDLVTIGAGSGGVRASRFAAQYYGAPDAAAATDGSGCSQAADRLEEQAATYPSALAHWL